MRILFLRSNLVNPDPRVEKKISSLMGAGYIEDKEAKEPRY
jgi:hypothetical protein